MPDPDVDGRRPQSRWRRFLTRVAVTVAGSVVLVAGLVMMVTPGPGLVAIVAGLAILATEWAWAERWLATARRRLDQARVAAFGNDARGRRRSRWLAGGAVAAALLAGLATLLVVPDLLGG